jgi:hypothetical protein
MYVSVCVSLLQAEVFQMNPIYQHIWKWYYFAFAHDFNQQQDVLT